MTGHTSRPVRTLASLLALTTLLAACARDAPTAADRIARPDRPSRLLNPLCAGSGGTWHYGGTITTAVNWWPSGNPHRVLSTEYISAGGSLRLRPGVLVCFSQFGKIEADSGGYLAVDGDDTARVVLTATDPAAGWYGVTLQGTPAATSFIGHTRIEYVNVGARAVSAYGAHTVVLDSVAIRQSGQGAVLLSPHSRITDSRLDTITYRYGAAVELGDSARFIRTTVLDAAGIGVFVSGQSGVQLLGGRIEGSGGTGLYVPHSGAVSAFQPIRITGGSTYPAEMPVDAVARGYGTVAEMDSLVGNARDTLLVTGGTLTSAAFPVAALPWRITAWLEVGTGGSLRPQPGARLVFAPYSIAWFHDGGRLLARGTQAAPVVFTADDPAMGWGGFQLEDAPSSISYLTNARVEHAGYYYAAVYTYADHPVIIDSTVIYRAGAAAVLHSGSRMSRTRVDTTLNGNFAAVDLYGNARLESTLIRGASGTGLVTHDSTVQLVSCEVRGSVGDGIRMQSQPVEVHNCNLVDNGGYGIENWTGVTADVENNWWGDAAGPAGTGGDGVSNGDYTPWRTTPYTLPYVP